MMWVCTRDWRLRPAIHRCRANKRCVDTRSGWRRLPRDYVFWLVPTMLTLGVGVQLRHRRGWRHDHRHQ